MHITGSLKPDKSPGRQIASISLRTDSRLLQAAGDFIADIALLYGLKKRQIEHLNTVLVKVCTNALDYGYEGRTDASIEIIAEEKAHSLVIAVEDQGLPFDYQRLEKGQDKRFADILSRKFADDIHFISLGKKGNRVEIVKHIPLEDIRESLPEQVPLNEQDVIQAHPQEVLTSRLMRPGEARDLARVVYRCYGYSYACDFVYFPEKVASRLKAGTMVSFITLNKEQEIVGHLALNFHRPGARVAEAGQAVVDPRYRGHGIFKALKLKLKDYASDHSISGIYSEAVTVHPYSQKGNIALGAGEVGFLLGYSPGSVRFQNISEEEHVSRQSVAFMYLPVKDVPESPVHVPLSYGDLIRSIYANLGMERTVLDEPEEVPSLPRKGLLHLTFRPDHNQAWLSVDELGQDTFDALIQRKKKLRREGIQCIYIDLPLEFKGSADLAEKLHREEFFFGALIPHYEKGDVLRLQHLNNVELNTRDIQVASDFGRNLLDRILLDWKDADGS
jgi:serine/threonine-protein kinase RsbW